MILVLTNENDRTADRVIAELRRRVHPVCRFDLSDFPCRLSVTGHFDSGAGWLGTIRTEDGLIELGDVKAIYYRRPTAFSFPDGIAGSDLVFATAEARRGLGGLLLSVPVRWVNHPSKVADAEFKPIQLTVAAQCGLAVPRTVLTNEPQVAREFFRSSDSTILYKPLSAANIVTPHGVALVFTSRIRVDDINDDDFSVTMNLIQEWVPKRFDSRVTVFGDRVFGVAIHAETADAQLDWRIDYSALRYEPVTVPESIADATVAYLERFGLLYGAFDFAVTDDEWYFLECNANGQYGWIEAETGLPMTEALVDLLTCEDT